MNYEKLYHKLFNDITNIIVALEENPRTDVLEMLKTAQSEAEDLYLDMCDIAYPNGEDLESE